MRPINRAKAISRGIALGQTTECWFAVSFGLHGGDDARAGPTVYEDVVACGFLALGRFRFGANNGQHNCHPEYDGWTTHGTSRRKVN